MTDIREKARALVDLRPLAQAARAILDRISSLPESQGSSSVESDLYNADQVIAFAEAVLRDALYGEDAAAPTEPVKLDLEGIMKRCEVAIVRLRRDVRDCYRENPGSYEWADGDCDMIWALIEEQAAEIARLRAQAAGQGEL